MVRVARNTIVRKHGTTMVPVKNSYPGAFRGNFPLIISGYTTDSGLGDYYKRASLRLSRSCIKFDLPHAIFPWRKQKDWVAGCALKPALILHVLKTFRRPVLWIDADAEIFQYPQIFDTPVFSMALHSATGHWLSGTLYLNCQTIEFVEAWHNNTKSSTPDEISLLHTYNRFEAKKRAPKLKILPSSYNTVVHTKTKLTNVIIGHYIRKNIAGSRGVEAVELNEKF